MLSLPFLKIIIIISISFFCERKQGSVQSCSQLFLDISKRLAGELSSLSSNNFTYCSFTCILLLTENSFMPGLSKTTDGGFCSER